MAVRVLIAGSDASARKKIKRTLRQETGVEIVGESADGFETVLLIEKHEPDLVFLEIQMPDTDGFEIFKGIKIDKKPFVIFVSATESLAAKAFEIGAADYLVKPFSKQRLQTAFNRTRERIEGRQNGSIEKLLDSFLNKLSAKKDFPDKIMLKTANGVYFINTGEIDWIEAAGNYVKLHVKDSGHLLRETMNNIEAKLNPDKFLRIHRSHLVNIDRIKELQPLFNGDYIVILHDNTELNLSRNYHDRLQRLFDKFS
jgi:two-component system, LytTR family, response regulator